MSERGGKNNSGDYEYRLDEDGSLVEFPEVVLFTSHDHEFINTIANRIIEMTPEGIIDRLMSYDEYLESLEVSQAREEIGA